MKRILIPASGAALATGLLAAGLAGTAEAAPKWASDNLAATPAEAYSVAEFWLKANAAALKSAKEYTGITETKNVPKLISGGTPDVDGKAGQINPTGTEKKTSKSKNVNLPRTIGKVFFETAKGDLSWCSATSIHSNHRNLVATAGHCVYDTQANGDVMKNWVFVPGYYQGKAPWGIYVGKQAFTHYDFDVYEDFDRDYAFVTVYNGFSFGDKQEVSKEEYDKWTGDKWVEKVEISEEEYKKCVLNLGECWAEGENTRPQQVGPDYPGAVLERVEVTEQQYNRAPVGKGNGHKLGEPVTEMVTQKEWRKYRGPGKKWVDRRGNYYITHYYVQRWVKPGTAKKFFTAKYFIGKVVDRGRLGDNVGGQGFTWNQKVGQPVFVFGYPAGAHPDGNKAYTGVTPKWCYSKKPSDRVFKAPEFKVEEHVAIKCAMTPGVSGGPWLVKYKNATRLGYVNGVASLVGDQDKNGRYDLLTSPYFDGETASVYNKAAATWSGSIVGKNGEILK
ncbi:trypsin-like serine peptidase [Thermostaphylospora chromogena]|uniref:V8-like Glu-specific endopeptidase n=1 Tax=Thermostaphylospora chromogena TaxID=35622 RepID=A0A1H1AMF5_9ACTN|nr:hypothetical protein [Thermostaphylospora chromogena]SDQ40859.1 hypothetical protein SAMN04489764_0564 [Thermostaphylospora chromogena]